MKTEVEAKAVREVMTTNPITVSLDTTIAELKRMLELHDFNMVPVVDRCGLCCGVVTKLDLLRTCRLQLRHWIRSWWPSIP